MNLTYLLYRFPNYLCSYLIFIRFSISKRNNIFIQKTVLRIHDPRKLYHRQTVLKLKAMTLINKKEKDMKTIKQKNPWTIICFLASVILLSITACNQKETKNHQMLKAGASIVEINQNETPASKSGTSSENVSNEPLYAKTLILDNGEERIAFVVVDSRGLATFITDAAKEKISQETDILPTNIMISATNTRTAEIVHDEPLNFSESGDLNEYQKWLIDKISESVHQADENLEPAQIAWESIEGSDYTSSKTSKKQIDSIDSTVNSYPEGEESSSENSIDLSKSKKSADSNFSFIAVRSVSGDPICILGNYSSYSISNEKEKDLSVSSYGEINRQLEELMPAVSKKTKPFVTIMTKGTSTSVAPIDSTEQGAENNESTNPLTESIANDVAAHYQSLTFKDWLPIKISTKNITLKLHNFDAVEDTSEIAENDTSMSDTLNKEDNSSKSKVAKEYPKESDFPLQTIVIGDLAIAAIPFEVFAETGLKIKEANVFPHSFTIAFANGNWGYLPTSQQYEDEENNTWISESNVQKNASEFVSDQLLDQFSALRANKK